jgi:peptidylprolyl isomerase
MSKRLLLSLCGCVLALAVAACGSSKAPGVQSAPSSGLTATVTTTATVPPALSKEPVVTVPKGAAPTKLVVKDLVKGTGQTLKEGESATVNYVGVLYKTGKTFDSSWSRNQPFTTPLSPGSVIAGWVYGLPGMKVGGRRELIIPPSDGYGKAGQPPTIPGNSTLIFVVDLLSIGS